MRGEPLQKLQKTSNCSKKGQFRGIALFSLTKMKKMKKLLISTFALAAIAPVVILPFTTSFSNETVMTDQVSSQDVPQIISATPAYNGETNKYTIELKLESDLTPDQKIYVDDIELVANDYTYIAGTYPIYEIHSINGNPLTPGTTYDLRVENTTDGTKYETTVTTLNGTVDFVYDVSVMYDYENIWLEGTYTQSELDAPVDNIHYIVTDTNTSTTVVESDIALSSTTPNSEGTLDKTNAMLGSYDDGIRPNTNYEIELYAEEVGEDYSADPSSENIHEISVDPITTADYPKIGMNASVLISTEELDQFSYEITIPQIKDTDGGDRYDTNKVIIDITVNGTETDSVEIDMPVAVDGEYVISGTYGEGATDIELNAGDSVEVVVSAVKNYSSDGTNNDVEEIWRSTETIAMPSDPVVTIENVMPEKENVTFDVVIDNPEQKEKYNANEINVFLYEGATKPGDSSEYLWETTYSNFDPAEDSSSSFDFTDETSGDYLQPFTEYTIEVWYSTEYNSTFELGEKESFTTLQVVAPLIEVTQTEYNDPTQYKPDYVEFEFFVDNQEENVNFNPNQFRFKLTDKETGSSHTSNIYDAEVDPTANDYSFTVNTKDDAQWDGLELEPNKEYELKVQYQTGHHTDWIDFDEAWTLYTSEMTKPIASITSPSEIEEGYDNLPGITITFDDSLVDPEYPVEYYEVTFTDAEGNILWSDLTIEPETETYEVIPLEADGDIMSLQTGTEYTVNVYALREDGSRDTLTSETYSTRGYKTADESTITITDTTTSSISGTLNFYGLIEEGFDELFINPNGDNPEYDVLYQELIESIDISISKPSQSREAEEPIETITIDNDMITGHEMNNYEFSFSGLAMDQEYVINVTFHMKDQTEVTLNAYTVRTEYETPMWYWLLPVLIVVFLLILFGIYWIATKKRRAKKKVYKELNSLKEELYNEMKNYVVPSVYEEYKESLKMTKKELIEKLDEMEVEYNPKSTKQVLAATLHGLTLEEVKKYETPKKFDFIKMLSKAKPAKLEDPKDKKKDKKKKDKFKEEESKKDSKVISKEDKVEEVITKEEVVTQNEKDTEQPEVIADEGGDVDE